MWEIKKFNSGEWDIKLTNRLIDSNDFVIYWDWFKEPDILIPLLKLDCIQRQYGNIPIELICNYLPYARQDRLFNLGGFIGLDAILDILSPYFNSIQVMGLHSTIIQSYGNCRIDNKKLRLESQLNSEDSNLNKIEYDYNLVFPDENAKKHYSIYPFSQEYQECMLSFKKARTENGNPYLEIDNLGKYINLDKTFIICDDICDGGRTFIECASQLSSLYFTKNINIELMVYHAFFTHGLDNIFASGISKIKIINPDSYKYVCNKYPGYKHKFEYIDIKKELIFCREIENV